MHTLQKHPEITRRRLRRLLEEFRAVIYSQRQPLELAVFPAPDRITYNEAIQGSYSPAKIGDQLNPQWATFWYRAQATVPQAWAGKEVHLLWDSSSEACVWQDGVPQQGLTGSNHMDPATRPQYVLHRPAQGGENVDLYIEAACNGLFGVWGDAKFELRQAEIAVFNRAAWDLLWDFTLVADMAEHLPANTPRQGQALYAANAMANAINPQDERTWPAARAIAAEFMAAHNGDGQHNISAIGHAHIDTAWLWPLAETRRKCYRTFASAIHYMDDYPEYIFVCSQAQQYDWVKANQPELYAKIQQKVKEKRFVPAGGTWIEPDCNLPSGESLVRQFLFGQRFFRSEFGITCREFWNPDVFGYSGQLPQIMKGAGIEYFLTQKLSWNQFNKPTSHTFFWEGIDGSAILTHFPPADTYNANCSVKELLFNVSNFKDHDRARESYYLFGYGDGGGGPTLEMLEQLKRSKDVDGLPRVEIRTPTDFFARCAADVKEPTRWVGELYFELHRGTYTSQANNKRDNRRSELLLRDVELLASIGLAQANSRNRGKAYPAAELHRLWQLTLLNQFHDIIPGSSITQVYRDSDVHYADILSNGAQLRASALANIAPANTGKQVFAFNTLSAPRSEVVELPDGVSGGQKAANGKALGVVSAPAMGYAVASEGDTALNKQTPPVTAKTNKGNIILENGLVRVVIRKDGRLESVFDKRHGRDALAISEECAGNQFVIFDDTPIFWDAWDVDVYHLEQRHVVDAAQSVKIVESGPLRAAVEIAVKLSEKSSLRQVISLDALSARVDFDTHVDWNEDNKFLKVEFPLQVRSPEATYEIQFGHLRRPTHFNTSWDLARFEVLAHKWGDLSEPGFGVTLFNDSKYGYATHGNVMRLSLLRAPKNPDPIADIGKHHFRYGLMPHGGDLRAANVVDEGYRFNVPMLVQAVDKNVAEPVRSYFSVEDAHSPAHVIIDTVKKSEDGNDLIVRLYEANGGRGTVTLRSSLPVKSATLCNLLEENGEKLAWKAGGVELAVTPFQLVTVRLALK